MESFTAVYCIRPRRVYAALSFEMSADWNLMTETQDGRIPEEALLRFTSRRVFRHKRSGGKHVLAQFSVTPMGGAQYADAGAARKQAASGRGAVDPLGET